MRELLESINDKIGANLTKIKRVKNSPKMELIRSNDKEGDIYRGVNNSNIYLIVNRNVYQASK